MSNEATNNWTSRVSYLIVLTYSPLVSNSIYAIKKLQVIVFNLPICIINVKCIHVSNLMHFLDSFNFQEWHFRWSCLLDYHFHPCSRINADTGMWQHIFLFLSTITCFFKRKLAELRVKAPVDLISGLVGRLLRQKEQHSFCKSPK